MRDLYRKPGNPIWYGQFKDIDGERHQVCLHTEDRAEAVRRLRKKAATETAAHEAAPPYSLDDALQLLLDHGCRENSAATKRMYEQRSEQIIRLLSGLDVNTATKSDFQGLIDKRLDEGASRGTVYKELVTIRRALTIAQDRGLFVGHMDVIPKFRAKYIPRKVWLTPEQFGLLMGKKNLPHGRKRWLLLACQMGGRLSEIEGFDWRDVNLQTGWMHLRGTKTGKADRYIPISKPLRVLLEAVKETKRRGPVVGPWGNVRRSLTRHCKALGIPRVTPNDLRRTFASWLKQEGEDSSVVAKLLGHTSTRMVDLVYGHLADRNLAAAVTKLPASAVPEAPAGGNNRVTKIGSKKQKEPKALKASGS